MHNKIIRRLSCVGISLFLGFGCCFFNPIADLSAVRPLIVHADENTVNKDGFTAILWAVMSAMGVSAYCSGKNISDISGSIVQQFDKYATAAGLMGSFAVMQGTKVVDGAVSLSKDAYNSLSGFCQSLTDAYSWNVGAVHDIADQAYPIFKSDNKDLYSNGEVYVHGYDQVTKFLILPAGTYVAKLIPLNNNGLGFQNVNLQYENSETLFRMYGSGSEQSKTFTLTESTQLYWWVQTPGYGGNEGIMDHAFLISDVTGLDDRVIGTGNAKLDDRVLDAAGDVSLDFGSDALSNTATLDDIIDLVNTWQLDRAWPADYPIAKDTSVPIPTAIPTAIPTTVPTAIPTAVPTTDPFPDGTTGSDYGVLGLQDVFPFCIPFDLYNILTAFCATPETPEFTWESPYGDVTFDFHKFDDIAFWWRKALVILFLIWLLQSSRSSSLGD